MHKEHSDLVLDEEGALESKVSIGKGGVPFTESPALSLLGPLLFYSVAPSPGT